MTDIYDEFAADAIEIITEFTPNGTNATYVVKGERVVVDADKPWEDNLTATPAEHAVRILFLPDELEDRQMMKYLKGMAVVDGQVDAWMAPHADFTPEANDIIRRPKESNSAEFEEYTIKAIEEYRPENKTIVYFIEFGT